MKKRTLSFLAALMCLAGSNVWAADFTIGTPAELTAFAAAVNAGDATANATLTADIDMSGVAWTPIGDATAYGGTFDGAGFKISNLVMTEASANGYSSMFGKATNGAVIKNLTLDATCSFSSEQNYAAGFVGETTTDVTGSAGLTFENCVNKASATTTSSTVGGFVAHAVIPVTFTGSTNEGTVSAYKQAGGFVGLVVGAFDVTFTDCTNSGSVNTTYANTSSETGTAAGGLWGFHNTGALTLTMTRCVNEGAVYCASSRAGGLIGRVGVSGAKVTMTECVNRGSVTANNHIAGGFVAYTNVSTTLTDCCNEGDVTGLKGTNGTGSESIAAGYCGMLGTGGTFDATRCVNKGTIDPPKSRAAGFVAYIQAPVTLTDCYNTGTVKGTGSGYALTSGGSSVTVTTYNCWNSGETYVTTGNTLNYTTSKVKVNNSYDLYNLASKDGAATLIPNFDETWIANGGVTYHINATAERDVYYQTIGVDALPAFTGEKVYKTSDAGWGTFFDTEKAYAFVGVKAYTGKVDGDVLKLTEVAQANASTPVVLEGYYYNKFVKETPAEMPENDLKGTATETTADGSQYVLAVKDDVVGFYQAADGNIAAGKAYLTGISAGVKAITFGTATGSLTPTLSEERETPVIYDLSGRRVEKATKGLYIVNGKKVLK